MPLITRITIITMACGLILSALIFKIVYDHQVDLWKKDFAHQSQKAIIKLKAEMKNNERILLDILSFYDASPNITREAFQSYVSPILKRNKFIQAIEWAPRVSVNNRKKIERQAHNDGFSHFQFTERLKTGTLVKADVRPEYYPIFYAEPYVGNESNLGFDLKSESERLKTIEGSRNSGKLLATNKIHLNQSKSEKDGLLVFVPYYGGIGHIDRKLKGFVVGAYRLEDMVNKAINSFIEEGMSLTIYDGNKISNQSKLFRTSKAGADLIRYKKEIAVFGRSWVVLFQGDENFQGGINLHPPFASTFALILIFLLIAIAFEINDFRTRHKLLSESNKRLEKISKMDSLTGLANRRSFEENLGKEVNRSSRDKTPLSLILLDVDYFKKFNDTHGHLVGDECLKKIARVLDKAVERSHDLVARFGGEEFTVILPSTDLKGGAIIAERLRMLVQELTLTTPENLVIRSITISLGLVSIPHGQKYITSKSMIDQADKALYKAKEQGKNRVVSLEFPVSSLVP